jgi:pimeloyl-ACP methyl ester carboxylesterase
MIALVVLAALVLVGAAGIVVGVVEHSGDDGRLSSGPGSDSSSGQATAVASTSPEPGSQQPPNAALARFYAQRLAWKSCADKAETGDQCATLTVPLDYARLGKATIQLALLRVPASDQADKLGSLVVNPGGPGASGIDYAASAKQAFGQGIRDRYDIVGFDPRGVGRSHPIDCISDAELDASVAEDPAPSTPAEIAAYTKWNRAMAAGCQKDPVGAHIATVDAARDIDVLRAALGESKLAYFGASYGTELGTTYADLFPDRVGRFVLDGAVDPTLDNEQTSLQQAAGFETALRAYVDNCVTTTKNCFLGDTVEAGLSRIKQLVEQVEQHPLPAAGGRELTGGTAFYGIVAPLYSRESWIYLSQALRAAFAGDGSILLTLSDWYTSRTDTGYSDNSMEALAAITCLDDPSGIRPDQVDSVLPEFEKASPTFGDVFAWGLTSCSFFHEKADEPTPPIGAPGADPIVVIGTTRDPATPLAWAQHLAKLLKSGVLITRDGDGHTGYHAGNTCVDDAVEGYLLDGTVPKNGLSC